MSLEKAIEKLSPLSIFSLYILLSLHQGENHGYGVVVKTREMTKGDIELKTATVYSAINRFIGYGLVKHMRDEDGKKYYGTTLNGDEFLSHEIKKIEVLNKNISIIMRE